MLASQTILTHNLVILRSLLNLGLSIALEMQETKLVSHRS